MSTSYPIIDADGHVLEKDRELHDYLGGRYSSAPRFETYAYFPSLDGWNRGTGVPGKDPETPAPRWLQFLDELGVHTTVLYPTGGLGLGLVQNPEWACVLARAYNSWLADRFVKQSPRLKGVALLPVHEPVEAAKQFCVDGYTDAAKISHGIKLIAAADLAIKTSVGGSGLKGARLQLEMLVCELSG